MYKDEDKQKEANRQASQRRRDADKVKGMTADVNQGMTNQGMTPHSAAASVIPCDARLKVMPYDTPDVILCEVEPERTPGGHIRVSKPGDADYEPQQAFIESQGLSRTSSTKGAAL